MLLGQPRVGSLGDRSAANPIAACVGGLSILCMAIVGDWNSRMPVGWEVLVKFVDIESLYVRHDFAAQFSNVHIAEINVRLSPSFLKGATFTLQIRFTGLNFCLGS
eukprot:g47447.t1